MDKRKLIEKASEHYLNRNDIQAILRIQTLVNVIIAKGLATEDELNKAFEEEVAKAKKELCDGVDEEDIETLENIEKIEKIINELEEKRQNDSTAN